MSYLTEKEKDEIKRHGCIHVGQVAPEKFDCIDCDDNAKECNCHDCMGVFCNECNKILSIGCELVRSAYPSKEESA